MGLRSWASRSTSAMSTQVVVLGHVVGGDVVQLAGEVQLHPVREMAAVRQGQSEDGVAGCQQRGHHRGVGLGARVWLHIGEVRAEQALEPVDGELLGDVDVFAAAVVPPAGIALGVLVGQHGTLRLHHRQRREVLAGDHLEGALLTDQLVGDRAVNFGIQRARLSLKIGLAAPAVASPAVSRLMVAFLTFQLILH